MSRVTGSISFWLLVSFILLLALQWFPYTGIFLMMFGAAALSGLVAQAFLLSLFFEAVLRRIPLFLMIVPLAAYSSYYVMYAKQSRSYEVIDGAPKSVDKALHDSPESIVLGLRKRVRSDYADFKGDGSSSALIERIAAYPQEQVEFKTEQKAELFAQFVEFVHDSGVETTGKGVFIDLVHQGKSAPPPEMEAAIVENTEQLVPLRDAIVARFIQLLQVKIGVNNKWFRLLDRSLVALPRDAYAAMPDQEVSQLLDALAQNRGWDYFRYLYVRMADAGPRTLSFYEGELSKMQDRTSSVLAPVLAICRIGEASDQTRAILKAKFKQYSKSNPSDDEIIFGSTMFITLLRLGDPPIVDVYPTNSKREDVIGWYDAVRQGKGRTDIGPNNCHAWDKSGLRELHRWPSSLRPGLGYKDRAWIEAATK